MVKRGLSEDPKHREMMGECVWLFMHILDSADWETGIVWNWKDEDEAEDMEMPVRTLRWQREKLEQLNYITAKQRKHDQVIVIHKWTNPRNYSGEVMNESGNTLPPYKAKGGNKGGNKGSSRIATLSIRDHESGVKQTTPAAIAELETALEVTFTKGDHKSFSESLPEATMADAKKFIYYWRNVDTRGKRGGYPPTIKQIISLWKMAQSKQSGKKQLPLHKAKR